MPASSIHTENESNPWEINIPDHPGRADSPIYVKSRALMVAICKEIGVPFYGDAPWQDHHSGVLHVFDSGPVQHLGHDCVTKGTWRMFRNIFGCEWSSQFAADPAKVELARQNAAVLYAAFPQTLDKFKELGHAEQEQILNTPITTAEQVADYVDSIFNASQPLPQPVHTGTVKPGADGGQPIAGIHHYPLPVWDIQFFKHDDFTLWVTDAQGFEHAVVPVAPRGSGDARVEVIHAHPSSALHAEVHASHAAGKAHILSASHPLARRAFARQ